MTMPEIIDQLHIVYTLIREDKLKEAEEIFSAMKIVDTDEHLALPKNIRHLIWNLYEFLVLGDYKNVTDWYQIKTEFEELFPCI